MQINTKLSKYPSKIMEILDTKNLDEGEKIEILIQLSIKILLSSTTSNKDLFIGYVEEMYDALEEHANIMGFLKNE